MLKPHPYLLRNTIQNYEWGTKGKNAFIPKMIKIKSQSAKPYAELWMGTHPKASSKIIIGGREFELSEIIQKYPKEILGIKTAKKFSNTLPFLFKVLSADKALSIQAHPNKRQAKALHKKDPVNYPDENQKLEVAIALDSLAALVGFKPIDQIIKTLENYSEIRDFISEVRLDFFPKRHSEFISESRLKMLKQVQRDNKKIVKVIFTTLIKKSVTDKEGLKTTIKKLNERISRKNNQEEIEKHFIALRKKYKYDVGLLVLFFLNLVHLKKGEAIFTKPGIPHAYLQGNILECMSNSDNVIRAGLTPKYKDIEALLQVLTYDLSAPKILKGMKKGNALTYKTEATEFEIQIYLLLKKNIKFENQVGPRIVLVLEGVIEFLYKDNAKVRSELFFKGDSVFLPSVFSSFKISSKKSSEFVMVSVPV